MGGNINQAFVKYSNTTYNFKIQHPITWQWRNGQVANEGRTTDVVGFFSPEAEAKDNYSANLWVNVDDLPNKTQTLKSYLNETMRSYSQASSSFQVIQSGTASTLSGISAYDLVYTETINNTKLRVMETGTVIGGKVYYLRYASEASQFADYLPVVQKMIDSFSISFENIRTSQFTSGDLVISGEPNYLQWRRPNGSLLGIFDTNSTSPLTGMAFDAGGNLYVTEVLGSRVMKLSSDGTLLGPFGSRYNERPNSIVFDKQGNVYVGQEIGTKNILKFDGKGNLLGNYTVASDVRGSDWIELGPDNCTMYYTSAGTKVLRYDVCTKTQLPDFAAKLPGTQASALRLLPDGELLVADHQIVVRLNSSGNIVKTYNVTGIGNWHALNLDPDGTSFWAADFDSWDVCKFDISTGRVLQHFNAGSDVPNLVTVAGLIIVPPGVLSLPIHESYPSISTSSSTTHSTATSLATSTNSATTHSTATSLATSSGYELAVPSLVESVIASSIPGLLAVLVVIVVLVATMSKGKSR